MVMSSSSQRLFFYINIAKIGLRHMSISHEVRFKSLFKASLVLYIHIGQVLSLHGGNRENTGFAPVYDVYMDLKKLA